MIFWGGGEVGIQMLDWFTMFGENIGVKIAGVNNAGCVQ
jgi:hypothetical protein